MHAVSLMYHTKEDVKVNPFPRALRIHSYVTALLGSHLPNYSCGITEGKKKKTEGKEGWREGENCYYEASTIVFSFPH